MSDWWTACATLPWLIPIGMCVFFFIEWGKEKYSDDEHHLYDGFLRFWKERMK